MTTVRDRLNAHRWRTFARLAGTLDALLTNPTTDDADNVELAMHPALAAGMGGGGGALFEWFTYAFDGGPNTVNPGFSSIPLELVPQDLSVGSDFDTAAYDAGGFSLAAGLWWMQLVISVVNGEQTEDIPYRLRVNHGMTVDRYETPFRFKYAKQDGTGSDEWCNLFIISNDDTNGNVSMNVYNDGTADHLTIVASSLMLIRMSEANVLGAINAGP